MSGNAKRVDKLKDEGTRWQVMTAGAISGLVSRFVISPLDVIKIRLQLQIHSLSDPLAHPAGLNLRVRPSAIGVLKDVLRSDGLRGLWKGNVPAEALYLCYGSLQFLSYRTASSILSSIPRPYTPPDGVVSFVSGATAGTVATTATYPLDLLRTRFAAQGSGADRVYPSLARAVHTIYDTEGPRGFFRGLTAGVGQVVPYMGLFFLSYETLKPITSLSPLPLPTAAAGMLASVLSKTAVFPLDTVRKRLQVQGPTRGMYGRKNIPVYEGVFFAVRAILRREGVMGLYRGLTISLVKAAPTSAVTMWTYEKALELLMSSDR